MARGINKVIIVGNLGADPETRYMPSGSAVTNLSIATSETWKDKQTGEQKERTEWHKVAMFNRLAEIALGLGKMARSERMKVAFAHSVPFMEAMGDVSLGWMHLWRAAVAAPKVETAKKKKDRAFYTGQVKTAAFFINTILPVTMGKLEAIALGEAAAVEMPEEGYGGL